MYRIGWFSTGRDEAARQLLEVVWNGIQKGELNTEILFVFSNREPGEAKESDLFFKLVSQYHIPLIYLSSNRFRTEYKIKTSQDWRRNYDREVMRQLASFHPDLSILAGYMLIIGSEMCQEYNMINLHPAPPGGPRGTWQEVIWKLIEDKSQQSGVTMHLVTPELDQGPPVTYCTFPIKGIPFDTHWRKLETASLADIKRVQGENYPLFKLIRQHGLAREFPLLLATIKTFSQGKVKIDTANKRVVDQNGKLLEGYNLTDDINKTLAIRYQQ